MPLQKPAQIVKAAAEPVAPAARQSPSDNSSNGSTVVEEASKPDAKPTSTASAPTDSAPASAPKIDYPMPPRRPAKISKAAAEPVAQAERQSPQPARPKDTASSRQPAQDLGNSTAAAPATATPDEPRVADGMTNFLNYLMDVPSAPATHPAAANADAK